MSKTEKILRKIIKNLEDINFCNPSFEKQATTYLSDVESLLIDAERSDLRSTRREILAEAYSLQDRAEKALLEWKEIEY